MAQNFQILRFGGFSYTRCQCLYPTYTAGRYAGERNKDDGVTESNIADDAYQQGVQNACSDSIVAISILKIVFRV